MRHIQQNIYNAGKTFMVSPNQGNMDCSLINDAYRPIKLIFSLVKSVI